MDSCGWQWSGDYASGSPGSEGFRLLGRGDDVFRVNGHLIAPAEVEHLILRHPNVVEAAVVPYTDSDGILHASLYIVRSHSASFAEAELLEWVNERLPDDVNVTMIRCVNDLPVSINGKLQRKLLSVSHQT